LKPKKLLGYLSQMRNAFNLILEILGINAGA